MSDPVTVLGYLAATCDVCAADPTVTPAELKELQDRATIYRWLQMDELNRATARAILADMLQPTVEMLP